LLLALSALGSPAAPSAAVVEPHAAVEHRLAPEEVQNILDEAARKREASEERAAVNAPQVHGEVGFAIGTGGYRSAFGTAIVDLPEGGVIQLNLGTNRMHDWAWDLP
jgi:hypothetical protein